MSYFLRYTDTASEDLERGTSINASDFQGSAEEAAEMFGCDVDMIEVINGSYCQVLNGLCGYELSAETLEDAIEEVRESNKQFAFVGRPVIFLGRYSSDSNYVADGECFIPYKIEIEL